MKELNNLSYGLYIVCSKGEKQNGCVANTFMQVTNEPNIVAVTLNKNNHTTELISKTGLFTVSVLTEKTKFELIERFGFSSGREVNKFDGFDGYKTSKCGVAYISESTNCFFACEVTDSKDLGTHIMFFAKILETETLSNDKSCTYAFYHESIKPKPQEKKKGYVCKVCGYVHESDELPEDFICPICKQGASVFEKIV